LLSPIHLLVKSSLEIYSHPTTAKRSSKLHLGRTVFSASVESGQRHQHKRETLTNDGDVPEAIISLTLNVKKKHNLHIRIKGRLCRFFDVLFSTFYSHFSKAVTNRMDRL
jgi:hypothetical protein